MKLAYKTLVPCIAVLLTGLCFARPAGAVEDIPGLTLVRSGHFSLGSHVKVPVNRVLYCDDYSNITNFLGSSYYNGGATEIGSVALTLLVADDLTPAGLAPGEEVEEIVFSVANQNSGPVAARARLRFWLEDGGDAPGSLIAGFSFNAIAFDPGVNLVEGYFAGSGLTMPAQSFWAGILFDNQGAPATTIEQLNGLGQGLFGPPDAGSSADKHWISTNPGSNLQSAPPGTTTAMPFGGAPPASYAWEWTTFIGVPTSKTSWGRIKTLYR